MNVEIVKSRISWLRLEEKKSMTDKIWCPKIGDYRDVCSKCNGRLRREKTKYDRLVESFNRRYGKRG